MHHVVGDLFDAKTSPLAHCVSADLVMGAGIAKRFREKFQGLSELRAQNLSVGKAGVLYRDKRPLFYLVTKDRVFEKPSYESLEKSLVSMRDELVDSGWSTLAIPKIGCGIDSLQWEKVEGIIRKVFQDSDVRITVYSLPTPKVAAIKTVSRGASLCVPVVLEGQPVEAVIDTAAQITVLSTEFYHSLKDPPPLRESPGIKSAAVDGHMESWKCNGVKFQIGTLHFVRDVEVAPITDKVLLGYDFLSDNGAVLNLEDGTLDLSCSSTSSSDHVASSDKEHPKVAPIKRNPSGEFFTKKVELPRKLVVPPNSGRYFKARVVKPVRRNTCVVFQPDFLIDGLEIPAVLAKNGSEITLSVLNLTSRTLTLPAGTKLGTVTEAVEMIESEAITKSVNQVTTDSNSSEDQLKDLSSVKAKIPEHLQDLFERSSHDLSDSQAMEIGKLLIEFQDIFAKHALDIGCVPGIEHAIDTGDHPPIKQKFRRTPVSFEGEEEEHLGKLLGVDVIEPASSPWSSPPVLIRKKDNTVRYCLDYRALNKITVKDSFRIPSVEMCLDTLAGSVYFSTLDLASGYYNIKVKESDRCKTAFSTKFGDFQHVRLPFGLCNSPATFQRAMELILRGLCWKTVLAYIDDVIVLGSSFENHIANLRETFLRFRTFNLKLRPSKCDLCRKEAKFLGKVVSKDGVSICPKKLDVVQNWPVPKSRKDLESFVGYVNYHRSHVRGFAKLVAPLNDLIASSRKTGVFQWDTPHQTAFDTLRDVLSSPPCLAFPMREGRFILDTDASDATIGAELSQIQDGVERTIAYASNSLIPAQRNYCTTRKELLAVIYFTRHFRHYLLGRKFTLRTDHNSLSWLMRFKNPEGQIARWLEELAQYDIEIQHRPGKKHSNADALSRIPDTVPVCNCYRAGEDLSSLPCGGCAYCTRAHSQWERFSQDVDDVVPLALRSDLTVRQLSLLEDGLIPSELPEEESEESPGVQDEASEDEPEESTEVQGEPSDEHEDDFPPINWMDHWTPEEMCKEQQKDPNIAVVSNWIAAGDRPDPSNVYRQSPAVKHYWLLRNQLQVVNGVLLFRWELTGSAHRMCLVVPEALREEVLIMCHDHKTAGHLGQKKTGSRILRSFYWFGYNQDVDLYVATCRVCNLNKKSRKARAGLRSYVAGFPLERVHLDLLGPFTESSQGNSYVLCMIDQFTKWLECVPLSNQTAETVAEEFVKKFIATFGCPLSVHTDQGAQFESNLFQALCRILEISKTRTTPYHPASNGQVERYNRVILQMIRCHIEERIDTWDKNLHLLTMALHATEHRQTGFTPNRLMLGREVFLPVDVLLGTAMYNSTPVSPPEWVKKLTKDLEEAHEEARKNLDAAQRRQKRSYDVCLRDFHLSSGDLVYKVDDSTKVGVSKKLRPPWKGPYLVVQVRAPLFLIRDRKGDSWQHQDKLKPCQDRAVPLWLRRARNRFLTSLDHAQPVGVPEESDILDVSATPGVTDSVENPVPEADPVSESETNPVPGANPIGQSEANLADEQVTSEVAGAPVLTRSEANLANEQVSPEPLVFTSRGREVRRPFWTKDFSV